MHAPILRERNEPRDGYEPIPPWLTVFYGVILFFGGYYMASYNGGWRADVYDETKGGFGAVEKAEPPGPMARAAKIYNNNCAGCHLQGTGQAGQFPPLIGSEWVAKDHEILGRIILHGLNGPIEVQGTTYNGAMSPFKDKLSNEDIALVLTYIRTSWGNDYGEITKEQIKSVRETTEGRSEPWMAQELLKVEEQVAQRREQQEKTTAKEDKSKSTPKNNQGKKQP